MISAIGLAYRGWRYARRLASIRSVPVDRILCGGERGMTGIQYARYSGDLMRTSTPISESPHSKFLLQYLDIGDDILLPHVFEATAYFQNACTSLSLFGRYFSATRRDQIQSIARRFVSEFKGARERRATSPALSQFSSREWPPMVARIRNSDCYQVWDGNHRLAMAIAGGQRSARVLLEGPVQVTCLQQLLMDVSWNLNSRILYQPMESPEIGDRWPLVRNCVDRLELMQDFLRNQNFGETTPSYLDVACNYGWFVSKMAALGFEAHGVEIDSAANVIATEFLGIDPTNFVRSEVTAFLESTSTRYDVVSCFSLAHHFALQGGNGMDNLLRLLDGATSRVLFFEMGDENEAWFKERLRGWNPSTIATYLQNNTTFNRIVALGTDQDRRGKFSQNYGRTLFACVRDHT
jgi:hypothetical protein